MKIYKISMKHYERRDCVLQVPWYWVGLYLSGGDVVSARFLRLLHLIRSAADRREQRACR